MSAIKNVGLIAKKHNQAAMELAGNVARWLQERGIRTFHLERDQDYNQSEADLKQADLMLVFGGDGSMVNAIKRLAKMKNLDGSAIPIAGINLGRVGFLLEIPKDNWQLVLTRAMEQGVRCEKRTMLELVLVRGGEELLTEVSANEIVLSRGGVARLLALDLTLDGEKLFYVRADGLIISTPTGSTAYNSSAGGPLLHPALAAFCITAICPFLSSTLPLVFNASSELVIDVGELSSKTYLTSDGQPVCKLQSNDVLKIKGRPGGMTFAQFGMSGYLDKLRGTGLIRDSHVEHRCFK
ncbi:MAG: NAD(+)/NADH kinase [Deltaproteobacteria bacterium]|jgi:NAD+ kinase|nr:NAD(+)/NADH kinase [Deltaproteobacteria bacterium]